MSLLEDIFLQDEAGEAQELERVIEGDDYDRPRSRSESPEGDEDDENRNRDDEAEEDKRRVDPNSTKTKRVVKNPRFILNPARLTGPRGIQVIPDHFKDFKFKGKGHEKEDLDMVLKKLEHWAYRLYPKFQFEDCLKKIETLGKKRPVMVHLQKIRTDQFISDDTVVQKDSSDEETAPPQEEDEFDKLLQQQIELARATPAPGSVKKVVDTPRMDRSSLTLPKATSSPSISDEQKERMLRNRKLAEERRLARLKQNNPIVIENSSQNDSNIIEIKNTTEENVTPVRKHNKSNVIDSSDDECDVTSVNQAITVDIHTNNTVSNTKNKSKEKGTSDVEMVENDIDIVEKEKTTENYIEIVDKVVEANAITEKDNQKDSVDDVVEIMEENSNSDLRTDIEKVVDKEMSKDNSKETNLSNEDIEATNISNDKHNYTEIPNNSSLPADAVIEKDTELISTGTEENIEKTFEINKDVVDKGNGDKEKDSIAVVDEIPEDIMDVDFSEEF